MLSHVKISVFHPAESGVLGQKRIIEFDAPREHLEAFLSTLTLGQVVKHKLFYVEDDDLSRYIFATNWQEAIKKWRNHFQLDEEEPEGIRLIADSDEIIL